MSQEASPAIQRDRYRGVVLASACGDALGAPHEFGPPLASSVALHMSGGGYFGWEPGEWTDDTQLALAILLPLSSGDRSLAAVAANLLAWYAAGPTDIGNQTQAALSGGGPLPDAARRYHSQNPKAAGNGGLMRIGPAALASPGNPEVISRYALSTTELTHAHPDCLEASSLWACAIDTCVRLAPAAPAPFDFLAAFEAGLALLPGPRRCLWEQRLAQAATTPASSFSQNGGAVQALQAALAVILHTPVPPDAPSDHLRAAIEAAVRLGGDTDTVAAIAGSLLGARWGADCLPQRWLEKLHGRINSAQPAIDAPSLLAIADQAIDRSLASSRAGVER